MPNPPSFPKTEISRAIAPQGVEAIQFDSPFSFKNAAVRDAAYLALTSSIPTLTQHIATASEIPDAGATFQAFPTLGVITIGQVILLGDGTLWRLADALGNNTPSSTRVIPDDYHVDDNDVAWEAANIAISAAAATLTGDTLASGVIYSSLTMLGTLEALSVNSGTTVNIVATDGAAVNIVAASGLNLTATEGVNLSAEDVTFSLQKAAKTIALTGVTNGTQIILDDATQNIAVLAANGMSLNGAQVLVATGDGSGLTGLTLAQLGLYADGASGYLLMTDGNGSGLYDIGFAQLVGTCSPTQGGTGAANAHTITVGGNVLFGPYAFTAYLAGPTTVTFPTSGTLLSTAAAVTVAQGGTGATTVAAAQTALSVAGFSAAQTLTAAQMQLLAQNSGAIDPKLFLIREDFAAGTNSTGNIGENGLTLYSQSGVLSVGVNQGAYPNLGQAKLTTGLVTGNGGALSLDYGNDGGNCLPTIQQPGWDACFILALDSTANCVARIGLINSPNYAYNVAPGRGLYVRYIAGTDTNWMFVSNVGGVETATSSGVAVSTAFVKFRIRMTTAGTALFSINGGSETAITTAIAGSVAPRVMFYTSTTAAKILYWDFLGVLAATSR